VVFISLQNLYYLLLGVEEFSRVVSCVTYSHQQDDGFNIYACHLKCDVTCYA